MAFIFPWEREKITDIWTWPHIFWVNIFGWWAEEAPTEKKRRWLSVLRIVTISYTVGCIGSMTVAIITKFSSQDISLNLFSIFVAAPSVLGGYKAVQLVKHRKSLKFVMTLLDELTKETTSPEDQAVYRTKMKRSWYVFTLDIMITWTTVIHWFSRPLLFAFVYGEKTTIMDTWPRLIDTWNQFTLTYVFQFFGFNLFVCGLTFSDNIFYCVAEYILCHLTILKNNLKKLRLTGNPAETAELRRIVRIHIKILKIYNYLNIASASSLVVQATATVVMICCGLFIITMSEELTVNILMNLGEAVIAITIFFYIYSWYCNELILQFEDICTTAYISDWVNGSENQKKTLLYLMTRTTSTARLGAFLHIDLSTFTNILKTAFSYYNFLLAIVGVEKMK